MKLKGLFKRLEDLNRAKVFFYGEQDEIQFDIYIDGSRVGKFSTYDEVMDYFHMTYTIEFCAKLINLNLNRERDNWWLGHIELNGKAYGVEVYF